MDTELEAVPTTALKLLGKCWTPAIPADSALQGKDSSLISLLKTMTGSKFSCSSARGTKYFTCSTADRQILHNIKTSPSVSQPFGGKELKNMQNLLAGTTKDSLGG